MGTDRGPEARNQRAEVRDQQSDRIFDTRKIILRSLCALLQKPIREYPCHPWSKTLRLANPVSFLRPAFLIFCAASLPLAAGRAAGAEDHATAIAPNAPVTDPVISTFTPEGNRSWLLRGSQCRVVSQNQLDFTNLNLTVFVGDAANHIDSIFLSPEATAWVDQARVSGPGTVRVITNDFEATGADWSYDHRQKKVSLRKNVRVVFHAKLQSILQ